MRRLLIVCISFGCFWASLGGTVYLINWNKEYQLKCALPHGVSFSSEVRYIQIPLDRYMLSNQLLVKEALPCISCIGWMKAPPRGVVSFHSAGRGGRLVGPMSMEQALSRLSAYETAGKIYDEQGAEIVVLVSPPASAREEQMRKWSMEVLRLEGNCTIVVVGE